MNGVLFFSTNGTYLFDYLTSHEGGILIEPEIYCFDVVSMNHCIALF